MRRFAPLDPVSVDSAPSFPRPSTLNPTPFRFSSFCFFIDDLHGHRHQPVELLVRCFRKQRFRPHVIVAFGVPVEQPADEGDEGNPLQIRLTLAVRRVLLIAQQRLEPMRVAERLGRQ